MFQSTADDANDTQNVVFDPKLSHDNFLADFSFEVPKKLHVRGGSFGFMS